MTLSDLDDVIVRLESLADSPSLKVNVSGGGVAEPFTFEPVEIVVVSRSELAQMAAILSGVHLTPAVITGAK